MGFHDSSQIAQRPSLASGPPIIRSLGCAHTVPVLVETPFWVLDEARMQASWLPHSLQLPGFLIDGDYYIIDFLDSAVLALGTLPLLEACLRAWHLPHRPYRPAVPTSPAPPPSGSGRPQEPPSPVAKRPSPRLGRAQAGSQAGAPQISGSAGRARLYQRLSKIVEYT